MCCINNNVIRNHTALWSSKIFTCRRNQTKRELKLHFFFLNLTYSGWISLLPSCLWSLRIFPSLPGSRLTIFKRDASSAILQLVNQWLYFTSSRSHAFHYGRNYCDRKSRRQKVGVINSQGTLYTIYYILLFVYQVLLCMYGHTYSKS